MIFSEIIICTIGKIKKKKNKPKMKPGSLYSTNVSWIGCKVKALVNHEAEAFKNHQAEAEARLSKI